ncbi:MAG: hypothetical protein QG661_3040 [Actinomycetota bacterium]|nr:hypothetical protein [Actinomycetota bacterium]
MRRYIITIELETDEPIDSRDIKDAIAEWTIRAGINATIPFVQVGRKD